MEFYLIFFPILIYFVFIFFKWIEFEKKYNNGLRLEYSENKFIIDVKSRLSKSFIGYGTILVGVILLYLDRSYADFVGGIFIIVGYQVFLWAIGIKNELLGNLPSTHR